MIAVPFTTENRYTALDSCDCRVIFTYKGLRCQRLGQNCTWSGSKRDQEEAREYIGYREQLAFHIERLTGPTRFIQAFLQAFGDVSTSPQAPNLYLSRPRFTTTLERPVIIYMGRMASAQGMSLCGPIDGVYHDGHLEQHRRP